MKYLVTFGNKGYEISRWLLARSALATKCSDEVIFWDDEKIRQTDFYKQNRKILDQKRGAGYWLWKPYIILEELKKLKKNDFLLYSDAQMLALEDCQKLYDICKEEGGILLFTNMPQTMECWCKRDALVLSGMDTPEVRSSFDYAAMMSVWQNTPEARAFLEEWLNMCRDERMLTDLPNTQGKDNYPLFIDHRHDQALFSLLAIKKGIKRHRAPNQYGKRYKRCAAFKDDKYGELFQAHFALTSVARNLKIFPKLIRLLAKDGWQELQKRLRAVFATGEHHEQQ